MSENIQTYNVKENVLHVHQYIWGLCVLLINTESFNFNSKADL